VSVQMKGKITLRDLLLYHSRADTSRVWTFHSWPERISKISWNNGYENSYSVHV